MFLRYAFAQLKKKEREEAYQFYMTDCLKAIADNTARFAGGYEIKMRFAELFEPQEKRTADEVIGHMKGILRKVGES